MNVPDSVRRMRNLEHRMNVGPSLTDEEMQEYRKLKRENLASQAWKDAVARAKAAGVTGRRERGKIGNIAEKIVLNSDDNEPTDYIENRIAAAVQAAIDAVPIQERQAELQLMAQEAAITPAQRAAKEAANAAQVSAQWAALNAGGGGAQGGRKTRYKKRRNRKTNRKNKNKKSSRRR